MSVGPVGSAAALVSLLKAELAEGSRRRTSSKAGAETSGRSEEATRFHKAYGPSPEFLHGGNPYDLVSGPLFARQSKRTRQVHALPGRTDQVSIHTEGS